MDESLLFEKESEEKLFLVDTNTLSELLRPEPNKKVMAKIKHHQSEIATAAQVLFEITSGCYKLPDSKRHRAIRLYIDEFILPNFPILPYDEKAAAWHGKQHARLVAKGKTPPFIDGQIAAIAITNELILVTRNIDDFKHFDGLKLENWFD
jgi:tRNA(fMet)-specific endonuclease VapC